MERCLQHATQDYAGGLGYSKLFDEVFLKLVALNKLLLFPICVQGNACSV